MVLEVMVGLWKEKLTKEDTTWFSSNKQLKKCAQDIIAHLKLK